MKTMKRIAMCLVMMGLLNATIGCDDVIPSGLGDTLGGIFDGEIWDDGGCEIGYGGDVYDEEWDTGSSSGTFFSDYGGSLSWW